MENKKKSIIGRNKRSNPQTKFTNSQGCTISDPQMISDEFNDFFVNKGPQLASTIKTDGKQYYEYLLKKKKKKKKKH